MNAQGELSALERGMHALNSGLGAREYAKATGANPGYVTTTRQAAEVFARANTSADHSERTRHLAEIHARALLALARAGRKARRQRDEGRAGAAGMGSRGACKASS